MSRLLERKPRLESAKASQFATGKGIKPVPSVIPRLVIDSQGSVCLKSDAQPLEWNPMINCGE